MWNGSWLTPIVMNTSEQGEIVSIEIENDMSEIETAYQEYVDIANEADKSGMDICWFLDSQHDLQRMYMMEGYGE